MRRLITVFLISLPIAWVTVWLAGYFLTIPFLEWVAQVSPNETAAAQLDAMLRVAEEQGKLQELPRITAWDLANSDKTPAAAIVYTCIWFLIGWFRDWRKERQAA